MSYIVLGDDASPHSLMEDGFLANKEEHCLCKLQSDDGDSDESVDELKCHTERSSLFVDFYRKYEFPLMILMSISLARVYPPLGAKFLYPHITAAWLAVMFIFLLSGLGLKTAEFAKAFQRLYFNSFIQFFNFAIVSFVVFGVSRLLVFTEYLDQALADGMVICACLAMAINSAIILTVSSGGDEASAVFNATFGNLLGIFLSPVLILMYLGMSGDIQLCKVVPKLTVQVVLPLIVGQALQKHSEFVRELFRQHSKRFKKTQEVLLVYIVYTVFCQTFQDNAASGSSIGNVCRMILCQFLLMMLLMVTAWYSLKFLFPDEPELRVMGLFGCVQKTVAVGIPMISSIYVGNPYAGLYALPLLIWHPMQLVVGSLLVPWLKDFTTKERKRLDCLQSLDNEVYLSGPHFHNHEGSSLLSTTTRFAIPYGSAQTCNN